MMFCTNSVKYLLLIFIIVELILLSIHIFSQGFLLKREALTHKSKCSDFSISCIKKSTDCILPKAYNKSIVLLIDALRYDFVKFDSVNLKDKWPQNKIKIIEKLTTSEPQKCKLFKFIADPPTTTMQRLKGLTTGSLPTFIDAGHNFASSEIFEDNIIDQMISSGKNVVVLGDDTWRDLYPNRFHRSYLFPSFNVMDLDTVDDGIQNHIYDEIKKKDWEVIIAHFLGVDHCGHRYGPSHPQMELKLKQMNEIIMNVTKLMSNDTLLVVMGDHGMTSNGDHGGDAQEEVETVLFFYSPGVPFSSKTFDRIREPVSQIDFVPTLASLLGIPIPFSNLGKVIKEVIHFRDSRCSHVDSLLLNFQQVSKYLTTYQRINNEFPEKIWGQLKSVSELFNQSESSHQRRQIVQYLDIAKAMCEEIWAKFNVPVIIYGLFSFGSLLLIIFITVSKCKTDHKSVLHHFRHLFVLFLFANTFYGASYILSQKGLSIFICLGLMVFTVLFFEPILPYGWDPFAVIMVLLLSLGSFSNSFVVMEDTVSYFVLTSLVCFLMYNIYFKKLKSKLKSKTQKIFSTFSFWDLSLFICLFGLLISVRLSQAFFKCREEQHWCDSSSLVHVPLNGLPKEFHNARYFTSLLSLVILILSPRKWLQKCGNLNGYEMNVVIANTLPILSGLFISGYWALQSVPSIPGNISKIAVYLPQFVYLVMVAGILVIWYNPLFVYILPSTNNVVEMTGTPVIPQLYKKLKQTYEHRAPHSRKSPVVYGLATSVSAPVIIFLSLIALSVLVIAGDGMAPGVLLLIIAGTSALVFHSFLFWNRTSLNGSLLETNWASIAMWFVLSIHGFYATGHQPTFPTLNWSSAFVGYDGTGSYIIPALLVIINTYSSQLLFGVALPLLLIIPLSVSFLWPPIKKDKTLEDSFGRGEFLLVERPTEARESLVTTALIYIFLHSFKLFMTSVAAFVLRRHLMVWKIFAPHFIFEAVGLMVTCCSVLLGLTFVFRVLSVLDDWSKRL